MRRHAAKLGDHGHRIERHRAGGFWLIETIRNALVSPYHGADPLTLREVETEIAKLEAAADR